MAVVPLQWVHVLGWAIREDITIGLETIVWANRFEGDFVDRLTWTFSVNTLALTYFPANMGFFVRSGVGLGIASIELDQGLSATVSDTEAGFGFLVAAGYEWRFNERLAIGPEVDYAFIDINGDLTNNVDFVLVSGQATWYW